MEYFRIGPTPWLMTSQPASVSMGEPQLPDLQKLPAIGWLEQRNLRVPEVQIVRVHEVEILGILP